MYVICLIKIAHQLYLVFLRLKKDLNNYNTYVFEDFNGGI